MPAIVMTYASHSSRHVSLGAPLRFSGQTSLAKTLLQRNVHVCSFCPTPPDFFLDSSFTPIARRASVASTYSGSTLNSSRARNDVTAFMRARRDIVLAEEPPRLNFFRGSSTYNPTTTSPFPERVKLNERSCDLTMSSLLQSPLNFLMSQCPRARGYVRFGQPAGSRAQPTTAVETSSPRMTSMHPSYSPASRWLT